MSFSQPHDKSRPAGAGQATGTLPPAPLVPDTMAVLVVEDNEGDAVLIREWLAESPRPAFTVTLVTQVAEAVERLRRDHYDAVLLDLSLPDSHGLETLHAVQQASPSVPIVIVSGLADESRALASVQAGAQDYLVKGAIEAKTLVHSLRYAVERKQTETLLLQTLEELGRANEALSQAHDDALETTRLKAQFLTTVTHELLTPLNGILGMTGLLLDSELSSLQRECAEAVRRSGEALRDTIQPMIDLVDLEASAPACELVDFDPRAVVQKALKPWADGAARKGLALSAAVDPAVPATVQGDSRGLSQILRELVGNAIKFTPAGRVTVEVTADGDVNIDASSLKVSSSKFEVGKVESSTFNLKPETFNFKLETSNASPETDLRLHFAVRDTGIGIAAESKGRLFQPFSQVDGSLTRRHGGMGLGLALVKRLVELMGGAISVESEVGQGSCFRFTIRVGSRRPGSSSPPTHVDILLVGIDLFVQAVIGTTVAPFGARVEVVVGGLQAVETIGCTSYGLVLVACGESEPDRDKAVTTLRLIQQAAPGLPVVALCAEPNLKEHCRQAGFTACLDARPRRADLVSTVLRFVRRPSN